MVEESAGPVVIGMDPHKPTVMIEVMSSSEEVVRHGRFTNHEAGFAALLDPSPTTIEPHQDPALTQKGARSGWSRFVCQRLGE